MDTSIHFFKNIQRLVPSFICLYNCPTWNILSQLTSENVSSKYWVVPSSLIISFILHPQYYSQMKTLSCLSALFIHLIDSWCNYFGAQKSVCIFGGYFSCLIRLLTLCDAEIIFQHDPSPNSFLYIMIKLGPPEQVRCHQFYVLLGMEYWK